MIQGLGAIISSHTRMDRTDLFLTEMAAKDIPGFNTSGLPRDFPYARYRADVEIKYSLRAEGYPASLKTAVGDMINPSDLKGTNDIGSLWTALRSGVVRWRLLSAAEVEEVREDVAKNPSIKKRKAASQATETDRPATNKKRRTTRTTSAEEITPEMDAAMDQPMQ